jgi:bifunctional non-homologous end joining protein LigD
MSHRMRRGLLQRSVELAEPLTPFTGPIPATDSVCWVRPEVVVEEVEYRQFTGRLRHPPLKRVAADVDSAAVALPARI